MWPHLQLSSWKEGQNHSLTLRTGLSPALGPAAWCPAGGSTRWPYWLVPHLPWPPMTQAPTFSLISLPCLHHSVPASFPLQVLTPKPFGLRALPTPFARPFAPPSLACPAQHLQELLALVAHLLAGSAALRAQVVAQVHRVDGGTSLLVKRGLPTNPVVDLPVQRAAVVQKGLGARPVMSALPASPGALAHQRLPAPGWDGATPPPGPPPSASPTKPPPPSMTSRGPAEDAKRPQARPGPGRLTLSTM